jgi:DNA-binding IclR family transcriptional regulator
MLFAVCKSGEEDLPMELLVRRIRSEYLEMPGLSLTPCQASRLWALDMSTTEWILETLVSVEFLRRNAAGAYRLWIKSCES